MQGQGGGEEGKGEVGQYLGVVAREGDIMQFGAVTTSFGEIASFVMQFGKATSSTRIAATLAIGGSLDVGAIVPSCPKTS